MKLRGGRKNHKNTDMLMSVPRYRDLLEDQADEDPSERGRLLVSSAAGWRTEMAKWIAHARATEVEEREEASASFDHSSDDEDDFPAEVSVPPRLESQHTTSSPTAKLTLKKLFSGLPPIKSVRLKLPEERPPHLEREQELMQALAEEVVDDGDDGEQGNSDGQAPHDVDVWAVDEA